MRPFFYDKEEATGAVVSAREYTEPSLSSACCGGRTVLIGVLEAARMAPLLQGAQQGLCLPFR